MQVLDSAKFLRAKAGKLRVAADRTVQLWLNLPTKVVCIHLSIPKVSKVTLKVRGLLNRRQHQEKCLGNVLDILVIFNVLNFLDRAPRNHSKT